MIGASAILTAMEQKNEILDFYHQVNYITFMLIAQIFITEEEFP